MCWRKKHIDDKVFGVVSLGYAELRNGERKFPVARRQRNLQDLVFLFQIRIFCSFCYLLFLSISLKCYFLLLCTCTSISFYLYLIDPIQVWKFYYSSETIFLSILFGTERSFNKNKRIAGVPFVWRVLRKQNKKKRILDVLLKCISNSFIFSLINSPSCDFLLYEPTL